MRSIRSIIFVGLLGVILSIGACNGGPTDHPASSLQHTLSAKLANPDVCPSETSQDVQQIVNAAGSDGIIRLPEGCYRVTSVINIPPCIHLVGAGADKTSCIAIQTSFMCNPSFTWAVDRMLLV